MEDGREKGREQSECLSPPGLPAPRCFSPMPWPPLSSLLRSFLLPPLFPLPSLLLLLLLTPSFSQRNPAPCLLPPSSPPLSRRMRAGHDGSRSSMDGAATVGTTGCWASGAYRQDGGGRSTPGAEDAGSYSPVGRWFPIAEHSEEAGTMTTNKMALSPDPTSFPGTRTHSCPQPSAYVVPDGSRSPSAARCHFYSSGTMER